MPNISSISMQENGFVHPARATFFGGKATANMGRQQVDCPFIESVLYIIYQ
jgi:hypothetical protein